MALVLGFGSMLFDASNDSTKSNPTLYPAFDLTTVVVAEHDSPILLRRSGGLVAEPGWNLVASVRGSQRLGRHVRFDYQLRTRLADAEPDI